jgi:hypothetical protein
VIISCHVYVVASRPLPFDQPPGSCAACGRPLSAHAKQLSPIVPDNQAFVVGERKLLLPRDPMVFAEPSIDDLRKRKELEARSSPQPFEWASRVYVTVGGEVRWRCCGSLFDDDHSPYCQNATDASGGRGW